MQAPTDRIDDSYISAVVCEIIAKYNDVPSASIDFDGDSIDDIVDEELREQFEKTHARRH